MPRLTIITSAEICPGKRLEMSLHFLCFSLLPEGQQHVCCKTKNVNIMGEGDIARSIGFTSRSESYKEIISCSLNHVCYMIFIDHSYDQEC